MSLRYFLALFMLALPSEAMAQNNDQKSLGEFGVWQAFQFTEGGSPVCYMAAKPEKDEGDYKKRGDIVAMITNRPGESTKDVFSYMAGYGYKKGSDVTVTIDGQSFTLFTQNDMAWAADAAADAKLAQAIQKGSKMTVKGVSSKDTKTSDTFSLKGSTKAYEAISKACGK